MPYTMTCEGRSTAVQIIPDESLFNYDHGAIESIIGAGRAEIRRMCERMAEGNIELLYKLGNPKDTEALYLITRAFSILTQSS